MKQRDIFLDSEGDAWFERNKTHTFWAGHFDFITQKVKELGTEPKSLLEIGCSHGALASRMGTQLDCEAYGLDPSKRAIEMGRETFSNVTFSNGTADDLGAYKDESFDIVVYGFCLYLCDLEDLHKIAAEADRVLKCGGLIVIYDFFSGVFRLSDYKHFEGVLTARFDWPSMFTWHPRYQLIHQENIAFRIDPNEVKAIKDVPVNQLECLSIIKKGGS